MLKKTEAYWPLILLLALVKFVLPVFLQSSVYELQRDEFLYYQQGLHLDLGYMENPPLLSYLGTISSWFGGSEAMIKFWPCAVGAATLIITCLITAELGGGKFAQFIAGLGIMTGAYLRVHFLFQPNILDVFFWTLSIYFVVRYVNENSTKWLYYFCISMALGFWGKYSILFMGAAIILALLLSVHRKLFATKTIYVAAALALLIILPNVWWQYSHKWPLFHHMKELQETQLKYSDPLSFLVSQLLMLFPVLIIWLAGLVWTLKEKKWRFIGYSYIIVITLLIAGSGKDYYALGAYPMLIAAGAVAWQQLLRTKIWAQYALAILILALSYPIVPLMLPIKRPAQLAELYKHSFVAKTGTLKWEDQKEHPLPQDFADMLGWKEMTSKAENFYNSLPDSTRAKTAIFCDSYGQAGALKFYGKKSDFRDKVISLNGSFLLWIPEPLQFDHIIFVEERPSEESAALAASFRTHRQIATVEDPFAREKNDRIFWLEGANDKVKSYVNKIFRERKDEFRR